MTREEAGKSGGFTVMELSMAGVIGFLVVTMGFLLYRSQTRMNLKQNDVSEAQLTIDYVVNSVRTLAVSAGGGLPQMANGIRRHANGQGFTTYINPNDLSTTVVAESNTDTADGVLPVADISMFQDAGFVFVTRNETFALGEVSAVDLPDGEITLTDPSLEARLGGGEFVYPVEYCSLFVDTGHSLRKTVAGKGRAFKKIPLATQVDSLEISFDLSTEGNGAFTQNLTDSSKISRVKLYIRVKGAHVLAGHTSRSYETIIGIRRGRLYNRAI